MKDAIPRQSCYANEYYCSSIQIHSIQKFIWVPDCDWDNIHECYYGLPAVSYTEWVGHHECYYKMPAWQIHRRWLSHTGTKIPHTFDNLVCSKFIAELLLYVNNICRSSTLHCVLCPAAPEWRRLSHLSGLRVF